MKPNRNWLLARMRERSTWLGIVGCLASLGVTIAPELGEAIAGLGVAAASLIAVITADRSSEERVHDER